MAHAATARTRRPAARPRSAIRWDRVGRVALLCVLGVILLLYVPPAKHWIEQSRTAGAQREELDELKQQRRELGERIRQLERPGALEREARRLGMVKRGERAFVIQGPAR